MASSTSSQDQKISGDEAQIYDRQIRLWGLEAQNRLRNSSVLLVGLSGLGAEIAKNLMLSGLKSLTLMDEKEVTDADKSSQFLVSPDAKGRNRAEASLERVRVLNPMVEVSVDAEPIAAKPESFYQRFDLVILIDQDYNLTNNVNKICRKHKIRFQAGSVFGWIGFAFFDFNNHSFLMPKPKEAQALLASVLDDEDENAAGGSSAKKAKTDCAGMPPLTLTLEDEEDTKIKKEVAFPSFEQTFDVKMGTKKLLRRRFSLPSSYYVVRAFLHLQKDKANEDGGNCTFTREEAIAQWKKELEEACLDEAQQKFKPDDFALFVRPNALNPVCAIVGSVLSQEAIKALSQNDAPLKSTFLYSALDSVGAVCEISV